MTFVRLFAQVQHISNWDSKVKKEVPLRLDRMLGLEQEGQELAY